jgi:hypothetical protein
MINKIEQKITQVSSWAIIGCLIILTISPFSIVIAQDNLDPSNKIIEGVFISEINFRGSVQNPENCSQSQEFYNLELETVSDGGLCNYDQWFEISNSGQEVVDIGSWVASFRTRKKPTPKFVFPEEVKIEANSAILVGFTSISKDSFIKKIPGIDTFRSVLGNLPNFLTDQIFYISNDVKDNVTLRLADNQDNLVDSVVLNQSDLGEGFNQRGASFFRCEAGGSFKINTEKFSDGNFGTPGKVGKCPKKELESSNDSSANSSNSNQQIVPIPVADANPPSLNPKEVESATQPQSDPVSNPVLVENSPKVEVNNGSVLNPIADPNLNPVTNPELNPVLNPIKEDGLEPIKSTKNAGQTNVNLNPNLIPNPNINQEISARRAEKEGQTNPNEAFNSIPIDLKNQIPFYNSQNESIQAESLFQEKLEGLVVSEGSEELGQNFFQKQNQEQPISNLNWVKQKTSTQELNLIQNSNNLEKDGEIVNRLQEEVLATQADIHLKSSPLENPKIQSEYFWFSVFVVFNLLAFWVNQNIDKNWWLTHKKLVSKMDFRKS